MSKPVTRLAGLEFSIKAELALIAGLLLTMLLGYPSVSTIPGSAILVFWSNRGLRGSVEYLGSRVRIQVIFAVVDGFAVFVFRSLFPQMSIGILFTLLACLIVPISLKCYYANRDFMPTSLTAIFSNLIILSGLCRSYEYGVRRVLLTFFGCLIGVLLAWLIPGSRKISVVRNSLLDISKTVISEVQSISSGGQFGLSVEYTQKRTQFIMPEIQSIREYLGILKKDFSKSQNFPLRLLPLSFFTSKYKKREIDIRKSFAVLDSLSALLDLVDFISIHESTLNCLSPQRKALVLETLAQTAATHETLIHSYETGEAKPDFAPDFDDLPQTELEIWFFGLILTYYGTVSAFDQC